MAKSRRFSAERRKFLKGAAVAGAAPLATPGKPAVAAPTRRVTTPLQDPRAETATPLEVDVLTADHCGSDFMVDVIKSLDIEYFCANPGSSFRALHESIVNYGGEQKNPVLTFRPEQKSVGVGPAPPKKAGKAHGGLAHRRPGLAAAPN